VECGPTRKFTSGPAAGGHGTGYTCPIASQRVSRCVRNVPGWPRGGSRVESLKGQRGGEEDTSRNDDNVTSSVGRETQGCAPYRGGLSGR